MRKQEGLTFIPAIIITIIIVFIVAIFIVVIISINSNKTENENKNNVAIESNIQNTEKSTEKVNEKQNREPDGTPYELQVKKVEKADANLNTTNLDHIYINDFDLMISGKLKEIGYDIKFNKDKTILYIVSKDNKYSCNCSQKRVPG